MADFALRVKAAARNQGARVLLNGEAEVARELGLDGGHWTSRRLVEAKSRPAGLLVGASWHDAHELARAASLGCDFAVVGPVQPTPSQPVAQPLGWDGFAHEIAGTRFRCTRGAAFGPKILRRPSIVARTASRCGAGRGETPVTRRYLQIVAGFYDSACQPRATALDTRRRSQATDPAPPEPPVRRHRARPRECDRTRWPTRRSRSTCSAPSRTDATSIRASTRHAWRRSGRRRYGEQSCRFA